MMPPRKPRAPRQVGLTFTDELVLAILSGDKTETRRPLLRAPKVQSGDELYPRVAFKVGEDGETIYRFNYRLDYAEEELGQFGPWMPGIHMPKARAPFFLPVIHVFDENLHDITEEGAKAEGAPPMFVIDVKNVGSWSRGGATPPSTHLNGFKSIWRELYRGTLNAWDKNPRVRVYRWKEVRRC